MGTRCDFYVGRGEKAEWLGSVAWDGHPDNFEKILSALDEKTYREEVAKEIAGRKDGTKPEMGWPWPWEDSQTTDYAVAWDMSPNNVNVWASYFGHAWFDPTHPPEDEFEGEKVAVFPNMKNIQKVDLGARSGVIFVK